MLSTVEWNFFKPRFINILYIYTCIIYIYIYIYIYISYYVWHIFVRLKIDNKLISCVPTICPDRQGWIVINMINLVGSSKRSMRKYWTERIRYNGNKHSYDVDCWPLIINRLLFWTLLASISISMITPGKGYVAYYATSNSFLLNNICLNQPIWSRLSHTLSSLASAILIFTLDLVTYVLDRSWKSTGLSPSMNRS